MKASITTAVLLTMSMSCSGAMAGDAKTVGTIFEAMCVGSHLRLPILQSLMKPQHVTALGKDVVRKDMPLESVQMVNPDNKAGWGLIVAGATYLVTYGEKPADTRISKSCTVSTQLDPEAVVSEFESSYKMEKVVDQMQGHTRVRTYKIDLLGFASNHALAIQSGQGMITVSLFEVPL